MKSRARNSFVGPSKLQGFTLIETMVTVLVLAILTTLALPAYRSFIVSQRVKSASFDLMSSLLMARSEAIKRNASISVTPNNPGWANGWSIAAGTTLIKQQEALGTGLSVTCYSGATATPCSAVTYNSRGRLGTGLVSIQLNSIDASSANAVGTRCISIDLSGRPFSRKATCV